MRIEDVMGYAAVFFGILGSCALYRQAHKIWSNKSAQSISGIWVITFLAMFAAFLVYGSQQGSFPMKFQGVLRVAFSLPVTIGFFVYGSTNKKHWAIMFVYALFLSAMIFKMASPLLFTLFSFLGVWSSFVQAYTIKQKQSRGNVAVELQLIYLAAIICWLVYGFARYDMPLIAVSVGFTLSYLSTIIMWFRYP